MEDIGRTIVEGGVTALPLFPGYVTLRYLATGESGTSLFIVRRSDVPVGGEELVLKQRRCLGIGEANEALQEVLAMSRLTSQYIVRITDTFLADSQEGSFLLHLVMEYCAGGDLDTYLHRAARSMFAMHLVGWMQQLLHALGSIHHAGLCHRDVRPQNIFLSASGHVKLGDLGLALPISNSLAGPGHVRGKDGSFYFMSPETLAERITTEKSDVWSLGCVFFEVLTGTSLSRRGISLGQNALDAGPQLWNAASLFEEHIILSPESDGQERFIHAKLLDLVASMLSLGPEERPSVTQCLEHIATDGGLKMSPRVATPHFSIRPLRKDEQKEAGAVLSAAYEYDPRFYYWTYALDPVKRREITRKLCDATLDGALSQKAVWGVFLDSGLLAAVGIVMAPDDRKRPPFSTLFKSGWKLLKYTKLLLPGMSLYKRALAEFDRVFPGQVSEWCLVQFGTDPVSQNLGFGRAFMDMLVGWCEQQTASCDALVFHQRQVTWLEKWGFQVISSTSTPKMPTFYCLQRVPSTAKRISLRVASTVAVGNDVSGSGSTSVKQEARRGKRMSLGNIAPRTGPVPTAVRTQLVSSSPVATTGRSPSPRGGRGGGSPRERSSFGRPSDPEDFDLAAVLGGGSLTLASPVPPRIVVDIAPKPEASWTKRLQRPMDTWTVAEVQHWVEVVLSLGPEVTSCFQRHRVDGATLITLSEEELKEEVGVRAIGDRRKIIRMRDEKMSLLIPAEQAPTLTTSASSSPRMIEPTGSVVLASEEMIPPSSLKFTRVLGEGHFGKVHLALWHNKTSVAVKYLLAGAKDCQELITEMRILEKVRHPHVVISYGFSQDDKHGLMLVTEFMEDGSLLDFLRKRGQSSPLSLRSLLRISTDISSAMDHLEHMGIVHRDLAARNVLVRCGKDDDIFVKLSDFGMGKILDHYRDAYIAAEAKPIPLKWTAPEAMLQNRFSCKSDVWSFGVTVWEIYSNGEEPYADVERLLAFIQSGKRLERPTKCPDEVWDGIFACFEYEPDKRPTFEILYQTLSTLSGSLEYSTQLLGDDN